MGDKYSPTCSPRRASGATRRMQAEQSAEYERSLLGEPQSDALAFGAVRLTVLDDDYSSWDRMFRVGHPAPEYIGLSRTEAEARAASASVRFVRCIDLDDEHRPLLTRDLSFYRLNLVVHHGQVVRAAFC